MAIILWRLNKKRDLQRRSAPRCPDMDENLRSQSLETLRIIFSSTEVGKGHAVCPVWKVKTGLNKTNILFKLRRSSL